MNRIYKQYFFYKALLFSRPFTKLLENFGEKDSERCIELQFAKHFYKSDQNVLDVGYANAEPRWYKLIAGMGINNLVGVDISKSSVPKNLYKKLVRGDIRRTKFSDETFDMIFCISILEHVGMDNSVYGNKNEEDYKSQLKALNEIYRITKIGGKVILTLPFGKFMNYKWFLQYDFNLLKLLTLQSNFKTMNIQFYRVVNNSWIFSRYYSCSDITYHSKESRAGAVVCVVLQK